MKTIIVTAIIAIMAPTMALAQTPDFTPEQRAEGEAQIKATGKRLADTLKDAESAKFRNVFIRKTTGKDGVEHVSLCGEINAKNSYGAMTGWALVAGDAVSVYVGDKGIISANLICGERRGVFDTRDYAPELKAAVLANAGV
jgi:hypothetical protein